jgi:hypothetical protein
VYFTAGAPLVTTDSATANGGNAATVSGTVNPEGQATTYAASYDTANSAFCQGFGTAANTTPAQSLGATDTTAHSVTVNLTGLAVNTSYCVVLFATNASGTTTGYPPVTFTTGAAAAPQNTAPPTISGTPQEGQTLTEAHGTWTGSPTSYSYQWLRCDSSGANCTAITGATSQTYTLTAADVGHTIRVQETATNAAGSASARSAPTAVVTGPAPTATTGSATATVTTITLNGTINPGGSAVTWQFQFGTSTTYNKATPSQSVAAGQNGSIPVKATVTALKPNTTYHYRLAVSTVQNGKVTTAYGSDMTVKTKPSGALILATKTIHVIGGFFRVPIKCTSALPCNGRFSITTKAKVGKSKKIGTVLCTTVFYRIHAKTKATIKAKVTKDCAALLKNAKGHKIKGQFTSRPRTGQLGTIVNVTLKLG